MFCWSTNTRLLSSSSSTTRATRQIVTKQVGTNKCAAGLNRHHHYQGQALVRCSSPGWPVSHNTTSSSSSTLSTTASPPFLPGDTDVNDLLPRTKNGNNGEHNINTNNHKQARFFFWSVVERRKQLARYSSSSLIPRRHDNDNDNDAVIDFAHNVINNNNNDSGNSSIDMTSMVNATDHTSSNNNDNYNFNNRNRTNEKSSRSSPSSLSRFSSNFNNPLSSSKLLFNHQYQLRQYLSSTTIFSSSVQLSSSMMMPMPSLSSPLRLCSSSSSSSSSPSAESADNGNKNNAEKNNDDEIDVASLADSAKKILQGQKIAPLILFETIGQVVGPDLIRIVSDFEKRNKTRVDLSLARSIRSMSAIAFYNEEFEGDVSGLRSSEYAELVDTIYRHHAMVDFLTDPRLDLAAKLKSLKVITVYDWYSVAEARQELQRSQVELINRRCAALYRKAEEENNRREKLETTALDLEKVFQRDPLIPGKSHRHTNPFAYGALARDEVMKDLADEAKKFTPSAIKEDLRIFATHSMPRQGKTRLGDELGHNKNLYGQLNGGKATADNTFIFNVTMNSNWQAAIDTKPIPASAIRSMQDRLKKNTNEKSVLLLCRAERELCRRIVGAAAGIYTKTAYRGDKAAICETFIEARDCNFEKVCQDVQQIVSKKGSVNIEDSNFVLIFDEITNLEELFDKYADRDDLKAAFYSMITPLIGYNCLVFLSGFSEARDALSKSGRKLFTVKLSPISSVSLRRELHTMKSKFFQFCAKNSGAKLDAIYYFELVKSAPGLLGTLLGDLQGNTGVKLSDHVKSIPSIKNLNQEDINSMSEILHLKSLVFGTDNSSGKKKIKEFINTILERAAKNKIADCLFRDGIKDLRTARLEPLFVEAAMDNWSCTVVDDYWTQLKNFSEIQSKIVMKEDTETKDCVVRKQDNGSIFRRFRTTDSVDATTKKRIKTFEEQNMEKDGIILEAGLRADFLEDAITTGLLAQRHLRRQAMSSSFRELKEILPNPSSSLSDYLHGSTVVCSVRPSKMYEYDDFPRGSILWNPPPSSSTASSTVSLATSIIEFDGHFPCVVRNSKDDNNNDDENNNKKKKKKKTKEKKNKNNRNNNRDDVSPEHCDSLDCVLVPRRLQCNAAGVIYKEDNPLVDVIINERFDDDSLVQFWIDAKHWKEEVFKQIKLNTNNINLSLKEIARRATVAREGEKKSNIRHIVHIIIAPFKLDSSETKKNTVTDLRKLMQESVSLPPPLKSYTLCFVSPDDLSENKAFENLVSQPIALTVPLIDQQMTESWTCGLPAPAEWWNYNATAGCPSRVRDRLNKSEADELLHKHCPVASRMTEPDEFAQWRRIRFNGDCAIGIGHLFKTEKEASDTLIFEGDINKELPMSENIPRESVADNKADSNVKAKPSFALEIPFGCILEALGILPPRAHGTSYCEYDANQFRFKLRLVDNNDNSKHTTTTTTNNTKDDNNVRFEIVEKSLSTKWFVKIKQDWLLDQIRVGHVLRFEYPGTSGKHDVDYQESDTLSDLWKKKFEEYRDRPLAFKEQDRSSKSDAKDVRVSDEIHREKREQEQKEMLTCSDLWNMSLGEFAEVFMVSSKNNNSKVSNKSDEDVSKEVLLDKLLKCDAVELSRHVGLKIDGYDFKI